MNVNHPGEEGLYEISIGQSVALPMLLYLTGLIGLSVFSEIPGGMILLHLVIMVPLIWYFTRRKAIYEGPDRDRESFYPHLLGRAGIWISAAIATAVLFLLPVSMKAGWIMQELLFSGIMVFVKVKGLSLKSCCRIRKLSCYQIPLLIMETFLLLVAADYVNACSMLFFENRVNKLLETQAASLPAALLVTGLAPAVTEEIIFRGLILRSFRSKAAGILFSSLLFALWHLNLNQMCYAFLAGLLLACLAEASGNLSSSMLVHFLFNAYNLVSGRILSWSTGKEFINKLRFGPYKLLEPVIIDAEGTIIREQLLWGFAAMLSALVLYMLILFFLFLLTRRPFLKLHE